MPPGGTAGEGEEPTTVLPCPACGRRNRVPALRLVKLHTVRCGACHQPMGAPPVTRP